MEDMNDEGVVLGTCIGCVLGNMVREIRLHVHTQRMDSEAHGVQ
jgi:hypothetical protein